MAENKLRSGQHEEAEPFRAPDRRETRAETAGSSQAMPSSREAPRGFMLVLLALITTIIALLNFVSWSVILGLSALLVPLGLWYYLASRGKPAPRPTPSHSGPYIAYVILLVLVMQFSRFWEVGSWGEAGAKWLVLFVVFGICLAGMRAATRKNLAQRGV